MKVIGYIRVSSDRQAEKGFSLETQMAKIADYCRYNELQEPEIVADEGISGRTIAKRDGIKSILERLPSITHIVVPSLSRLGRNTAEAIHISSLCDKHKVTLHVLDLKLDTSTAAGKMFFQIMASLAEFESNQLSERIRSVLLHKRKTGQKYSRPPLGFGENNEVIPEEMNTVRSIFELYSKGWSMKKISVMLNNSGITGKRGGRYGENTIKKILDNKDIYEQHL